MHITALHAMNPGSTPGGNLFLGFGNIDDGYPTTPTTTRTTTTTTTITTTTSKMDVISSGGMSPQKLLL